MTILAVLLMCIGIALIVGSIILFTCGVTVVLPLIADLFVLCIAVVIVVLAFKGAAAIIRSLI